jgi:integrase
MTRSIRKPKRKQPDSYKTGTKGVNRVRLYADRRDGKLYLEYKEWDGKKQRDLLDTNDFTLGKAKANELAAALLKHEGPSSDVLTLKTLFDNYEREVTPQKGEHTQEHDRRARKLFEACWGAAAPVKNLDRRDWDRFISQRRSGALRPRRSAKAKDKQEAGVGDRAIEQDLRFLMAVCNWADKVRVRGRPMLERNPFRGFPIPVEKNPRQPTLSRMEFERLREAAKTLGPDVSLFVLLAHETGHRRMAIARLRWSDVDLENGLMTWRAENDKMRVAHTVPLSEAAQEALRAARKHAARIGDSWVFPSPTSPEQPIRRDLLRDWWQQLEKAAKLERVKGRGWHSFRRKFATDRQDAPLKALQMAGGWKSMAVQRYIQPDEQTVRSVVERDYRRRAAGE